MTPLRRYVPLLIAGSAFIAAACRDAIAPTRSTTKDLATLSYKGAFVSHAVFADDDAESKAQVFTFKLKAKGGRAHVGKFTIDYPANAVCDPATSTYGPDEWNNPCETLNEDITVTARLWVEDGRSHTDFSPDLRFDPAKDVYMSTVVPELKGKEDNDATRAQFSIWYSRREGDVRYLINDADGDSRLASKFDNSNGKAWRKIQHFSGYFVQWGTIWCDDGADSNDPACFADIF